jgi:hypothetical protein
VGQRTAHGDSGTAGFARIRLNLDPESADLYDYLDMDWFTIPLREGRRPCRPVTAERRVVAANTPHWISGTRLPRLPAAGNGDFAAVTEIGAHSGWLLAATRLPRPPERRDETPRIP